MNTALRIALLLWVVLYLLVSCQPLLGANAVVGTIAFFGGLILFVPWVVGIVVLGMLIWITNPPRR
jgi:hypothetical protein